MASTTFIDEQTIITADWLNDINRMAYGDEIALLAASPDVGQYGSFVVSSAGQAFHNFTSGFEGQTIKVRCNAETMTLVNGATLITGTGATINVLNPSIAILTLHGTSWYLENRASLI